MIKLQGIKVVGIIDLKVIPKDNLAVTDFNIWPHLPQKRDDLDSVYTATWIMAQRNYNRRMKSKVYR